MKSVNPEIGEVSTAFRLSSDMLKKVDWLCKQLDLTRSQIFRRSVAMFVEEEQKKMIKK